MVKTYLDDDDDAFDANGICKPGRSVRVPVAIMDSRRFVRLTDAEARRFQPGFRACADADPGAVASEKARASYVQRTTNAWKSPSPITWSASRSDIDLAEKVASLLRLARPIATSSGPPFTPRFDQPTRGSEGADARREYVKRMSDAWKTPVTIEEPDDLVKAIELAIAKELEGRDRSATDPDAATAIEKRLERERGLGELAAEVEKRRAVEHQARSKALENAWRS